mgnify:FL=1|jgi:acyl-coenzyme A thioesterase PaaI-like protein|tara:strand:+ start:1266 stop:1736 length:471 start_codon:yes stop_codon:yes gene_type:complete
MMEAKSLPLKYWEKFGHNALGRWCFARLVCWRVPYFSSISPTFLTYSKTSVAVSMEKKRRVTNHLGTIHVIAIANLCELAAGTLMEAGLVASMRWIPKGMNINYIKKANTTLIATAVMPEVVEGKIADIIVPVSVLDSNGVEVVQADIIMYLTSKR